MSTEYVILVDDSDNELGVMEKLQAHKEGKLHRAFSVFLFNDEGELLLQQRALDKYHSAGLWTNTCCSHPRPGETIMDAANRRLHEEMGITSDLIIKTSFVYKSPFENGLTEHELDYVLIGTYNLNPIINVEEVSDYKWQSLATIKENIKTRPDEFTTWFKIAIEKLF